MQKTTSKNKNKLNNNNNTKTKEKIDNIENNNNEEEEENLSNNTYKKFIEFFNSNIQINNKNLLTDNIEDTCNLNQLIHTQTLCVLNTNNEDINTLLNIGNNNENSNDILIFKYINKSNLFPIIYNQILNICSNDEDDILKDKIDMFFYNKKCLIFSNNDDFINPKILLKEYIKPLFFFCNKKKYKNSFKNFNINNFVEKLYKNIYIFKYNNYVELLIKLNNLNRILKDEINEISLIIVDGLNCVNMEKIDVDLINENNYNNNNNENLNDNNDNNNYKILFKKKKISINSNYKKSLNENDDEKFKNFDDKNILSNIFNILINLYKLFNFNLIINIFDIEQYSFYKFISNGKNNLRFNVKNLITIENEKYNFIFKLPLKNSENIFYIINSKTNFINNNKEIFGILKKGKESDFIFHIYQKDEDKNKIYKLYETNLNYVVNVNQK